MKKKYLCNTYCFLRIINGLGFIKWVIAQWSSCICVLVMHGQVELSSTLTHWKQDGKDSPGRSKTQWLDDVNRHLSLTGILPHKRPDLVQDRTARRHIMLLVVSTLWEVTNDQVNTSWCSVPAAQRLHSPVVHQCANQHCVVTSWCNLNERRRIAKT